MANRLKYESSPYLLQHAENPVDWYPWGEEALQAARDTDKPIFLSIGYAACHWCHVMARESFEDSAIAEILNERFINIKVDREERPDIDTIYMDAVVAMIGQGGWPLSVFLTPQATPFFGGTYFPPTPRHNIPSFKEILLSVDHQWRENRQQIEHAGTQMKKKIASRLLPQSKAESFEPDGFKKASETLFHTYDWSNGGWGGAPKFPQSGVIEFLLRKHHRDGDKLALEMAVHALEHMACGGIFDQLNGGFHRYTVDAQWQIPHFEKMLYDNALLVQTFLHAWLVSRNPLLRETVEMTLDFLQQEMRHEEGGFYAAFDADSEGKEGTYYVWTEAQIRDLLDQDDLAFFTDVYRISAEGNFEGKNVLSRIQPVDETVVSSGLSREEFTQRLDAVRAKLLKERTKRIPPAADDKVITAWNGLLLTAYAEAARALSRLDYLKTAQSLAEFLLGSLRKDGRLLRTWRDGQARHTAVLEDHAALAEGLLALYQTDFDLRWYRAAVEQAEEILANFTDPEGGFFDTRHDHETLITRPKSFQDSPIPSGNTMAISSLLKLAAISGDTRYYDAAETVLLAMQDIAQRYPASFSGWLCNIDLALGPQMQVAIVGPPSSENYQKLTQIIHTRYLPRLVIAGGETKDQGAPVLLEGRAMLEGLPAAFLCQHFSCKRPTSSPDELGALIDEALKHESK